MEKISCTDRVRNRLVKHITEGQTEGGIRVTERRGRSSKQLQDDLKETRGYWKLKQDTLDHTLWRTRCGRSCHKTDAK